MQIQETITRLLDTHTEALGLNRRQVADLAGTNAGQLTNWLRTKGPLSTKREGEVADVVLKRVEAVLKEQPALPDSGELERLAAMLRSYGPRMRMLGLDPAVAREGGPIALDNPLYMPRLLEEQVLNAIKYGTHEVIVVSGGVKTGKSTLLQVLQERLERTIPTVLIDCAEYIGKCTSGADRRTAARAFYNWLSERCEDQINSGGLGVVWNEAEDIVPWLKARILAATRQRKVVILLDHLDKLGEYYAENGRNELLELQAIDLALRHLVEDPDSRAGLLDVTVVAALNCYGSKGYPENPSKLDLLGRNFLPSTPGVFNPGPAGMRRLLLANDASAQRANNECVAAAAFTGGHVRLAQAYAIGANEGESKEAVLRAAGELGTIAAKRGFPVKIENHHKAALDTGLWVWAARSQEPFASYSIVAASDPEVITAFLAPMR